MTMIASHRGGSHLWPENSRIAFRQTAELPVEMAEFDVHQTSDGVLVVHHDSTIDRMTDGAGALSALSYGELQRRVILGSGGETIPTLNEVIAIFKPSAVDLRLEIKTAADGKPYDGMEIRILDELRASDMLGRTLITSFALERLTAFRAALAAEDMTDGDTRGLMWLCAPSVVASIGWTGVEAALHVVEPGRGSTGPHQGGGSLQHDGDDQADRHLAVQPPAVHGRGHAWPSSPASRRRSSSDRKLAPSSRAHRASRSADRAGTASRSGAMRAPGNFAPSQPVMARAARSTSGTTVWRQKAALASR